MVAGLDRDTLLSWMREVDAGPFSVLAAGERVAYPNQDMMSLLAGAATVTERVRIEATVSITPMHPRCRSPSKPRRSTCCRVGGSSSAWASAAATRTTEHSTRRSRAGTARLDEQVATIRRVWAGESPGEGISPVGPAPVQPGGPPILAGAMGPKSMARAARWADGVAGFDVAGDAASIASGFRRFEVAWTDAGRSGRPFLQTSFWFGLGADAGEHVPEYAFRYLRIFGDEAARAMAGLVTATSAERVRTLLGELEGTGCDEVILVATNGDLDDLRRAAALVAR